MNTARPPLTPRETQIVRLLSGGMGPTDIGAELGISIKTVDTHLANISQRYGVNRRVLRVMAIECRVRREMEACR